MSPFTPLTPNFAPPFRDQSPVEGKSRSGSRQYLTVGRPKINTNNVRNKKSEQSLELQVDRCLKEIAKMRANEEQMVQQLGLLQQSLHLQVMQGKMLSDYINHLHNEMYWMKLQLMNDRNGVAAVPKKEEDENPPLSPFIPITPQQQ